MACAPASAAWRMIPVAASGCDTIEAWEADTSVILAFARSAMNRWVAAGIALSSVHTRYQHGIDFQAGGPDGSCAPVRAGEREKPERRPREAAFAPLLEDLRNALPTRPD